MEQFLFCIYLNPIQQFWVREGIPEKNLLLFRHCQKLFFKTKKCRNGKFSMSKFKQKSASTVLDWRQPPRQIMSKSKIFFQNIYFFGKKVPQKFWIWVNPPPPQPGLKLPNGGLVLSTTWQMLCLCQENVFPKFQN